MSSAAAPGRIPPETSSSWSLRKNPRDSALLVPEWSVPCNPLNWEEPQDAYDGAALRDRQGRHAHLHKDIQVRLPAVPCPRLSGLVSLPAQRRCVTECGERFRAQATHPNRGKVEKKLAGPGFSKITKSYSIKFKDDPDPVRHAPAPTPAAFPNDPADV